MTTKYEMQDVIVFQTVIYLSFLCFFVCFLNVLYIYSCRLAFIFHGSHFHENSLHALMHAFNVF